MQKNAKCICRTRITVVSCLQEIRTTTKANQNVTSHQASLNRKIIHKKTLLNNTVIYSIPHREISYSLCTSSDSNVIENDLLHSYFSV